MTRIDLYKRISRTKQETICHDADCMIFTHEVCTCGLLHTLIGLDDNQKELYPKFEEEIISHEMNLSLLRKQ